MPSWLSGPEIIVILVIVVILFGVGRVGKVLGELGKGVREFRREIKADNVDRPEDDKKEENKPSSD